MSERWVPVAPLAAVPQNGTLRVALGDDAVCLYNLGGKLYATHDSCTHHDASLAAGLIDGECIRCPWHHGVFHIPTGKALSPPVFKDVQCYCVKVEGDTVYVKQRA